MSISRSGASRSGVCMHEDGVTVHESIPQFQCAITRLRYILPVLPLLPYICIPTTHVSTRIRMRILTHTTHQQPQVHLSPFRKGARTHLLELALMKRHVVREDNRPVELLRECDEACEVRGGRGAECVRRTKIVRRTKVREQDLEIGRERGDQRGKGRVEPRNKREGGD